MMTTIVAEISCWRPGHSDLLELGPGLAGERAEAAAAIALRAGLALRLDRLDLAAPLARPLGARRRLVRAALRVREGLAMTSGFPCAACSGWRQYFFSSNRSGVLRFGLFVVQLLLLHSVQAGVIDSCSVALFSVSPCDP